MYAFSSILILFVANNKFKSVSTTTDFKKAFIYSVVFVMRWSLFLFLFYGLNLTSAREFNPDYGNEIFLLIGEVNFDF